MRVTRSQVALEIESLKRKTLRTHDLKSIAAMHPSWKMQAAARFLLMGVA